MCDSAANSNILTPGDPAISSAPPLILLQSEEELGDPGKPAAAADSEAAVAGTQDKGAVGSGPQGVVAVSTGSGDHPPSAASLLPSTSACTGRESAPQSVAPALADSWNLDQDDKNLFSGFSEEHLSKLDDVLSSEEVAHFLQQNSLTELGGGGLDGGHSVGVTPSSSNTSSNIAGSAAAALHLSDSAQLSEDSLKLELFDSLPGGSGLPMPQHLMPFDTMSQDSLKEYESVIMSAAVSDHAYAMPSTSMATTPASFTSPTATTTTTTTPPSSTDTATTFSPRKSARIKQRMDDGKSAFDYDSDFEYYLTPRRQVKKDQSDVSDAEKASKQGKKDQSDLSDAEVASSSPAPSSPAPGTSAAKPKQPKRRSTRIVDLENREKAEKILQENRQKEQEAMAAMQKQNEEEEEEGKTEEGTAGSSKEADSSPAANKGKKLKGKKGALLKGKRGKVKQEESTPEDDTEEGGTPKAQPNKAAGKTTPLAAKRKIAKRKKAPEDEEEEEEKEKEKEEEESESSPKKKKTETESGKLATTTTTTKKKKKMMMLKKGADVKKVGISKALLMKKKKRMALKRGKMGAKAAKKEVAEESSDEEDDIPLQAIAKLTKNEGGKASEASTEKPKKDQKHAAGATKPKTAAQTSEGRNKENKTKAPAKEEHGGDREKSAVKKDLKKRSMSESGEGKPGSKPKEKKADAAKAGGQQQAPKGNAESHSKAPEKSTDKTAGSGTKPEEGAAPAKPAKHKHRKSEEVIIDPTVTDLFKPDGVIPTEHKKEADAADGAGKEAKDAAGHPPSGLKKNTHGSSVHAPSQRALSADSKHASSSTHAHHSSSVESKTLQHGRSLSVEHKTGASSNGRSSSVDNGKAGGGGVHEKDASAEDKSSGGKRASGDGPKSCGDAGPDRKESVLAALSKHSVVAQAAHHGEHKGTAKPSTSSSDSKETSRDGSVKVKTEKEQAHSHDKEQHRHSHDKGQTSSSHHHRHHHHHKEDTKSKEHQKHSHHTTKKDDAKAKEERKSLFEVLTKSEGAANDQAKEAACESHVVKKERKDSSEKHGKGHKEKKRTKEDGRESGGDLSYEDDENDSDWEPSNDANTLYCICRKPHGHRFMICCDKCGEWYHGQCVGITKQQGHQMEVQNKEYVCPKCSGTSVEEHVAVKQETDKVASSGTKHEKGGGTEGNKKKRISLDDPKVLKKPGASGKEKWKSQKCIVGECKRPARLGSVYCSNGCIIHHARLSLRQMRLDKEKASGQKVSDIRPSEKSHVMVTERRSGRVLSGTSAPTEAQLELWLQTHPSFEVVQSSQSNPATFYGKKKDRRSSSQGSAKKGEDKSETSTPAKKSGGEKQEGSGSVKKEELKEEDPSSSKPPGAEEGPDLVRVNVRKSLRDALSLRAKEADDIVLSSNEIKRISLRIEEELFKAFAGTGNKYRAKFRSLLFNIKDQKNKGLFRKILNRKIRASHLVKMSTEELASKELSKWRKMENKHTLDMIEQMEKEALKKGQHIRKKTHKGEVEVEEEDMSTLVTRMEEPKSVAESKAEEEVPSVIADTTDQHRTHLFDLNCKICTGKVLPPASEETVAPAKKLRVAHQVVEESRTKKSSHRSKKKGVRISDNKEVKIVERKSTEDAEPEETTTTTTTTTSTTSAVSTKPSDTGPQTMSPDTLSTPGSSATSPGPSSLASQSPASTPHGPTTTLPPSGSPALSSKVTVRSPDSVLQSGLDPKHKYSPSGPMVWKGFLSMQDFAKFFTSAYRVSGPADKMGLPDTLQICGRIGPEQMWDYLGKIRQAGSRDICLLRFIPGSEDEKSAYVHLYSYLSGRSRCGVVGNPPKYVKDLYIVPLASHSKIPQVLLPFEGPGLEGNRPHMLIGIVVRQKLKRPRESSESSTPGKSPHSHPDKTSASSSAAKKPKPAKKEETEAYSPTAEGDDGASDAAPYIPTPTVSKARVASSTPSSSSSTPSSLGSRSQVKDKSSHRSASTAKEPSPIEDAEPYSPSRPVAEDDEDAPYDPEDLPTSEGKPGSQTVKKPDSKMTVAAEGKESSHLTATLVGQKLQADKPQPSAQVEVPKADSSIPSASTWKPPVTSAATSDVSVSVSSTTKDSVSVTGAATLSVSAAVNIISSILPNLQAPGPAVSKTATTPGVSSSDIISSILPGLQTSASSTMSKTTPPNVSSTDLISSILPGLQASTASMMASKTILSNLQTAAASAAAPKTILSNLQTAAASAAAPKTILSNLQIAAASAAASKTTTSVSSSLFSPPSASSSKVSVGPEVSSVGDGKSSESTTPRVSSNTPSIDNMPLALKALMEDLKGNTQMAKAVDKRTERDRREREKKEAKEASAKEATETEKKDSTKEVQAKESNSVIPGLGEVKESDSNIPGFGEARDESVEPVSAGAKTFTGGSDKTFASASGEDKTFASASGEDKTFASASGEDKTFASSAGEEKFEEVSSSTDTTHRLSPLAPKADLLQGDVDLRIQGEREARLLSSVHDQDDRFTSRLHPGPDSMPPPPPHGLGFPPPPPSASSFMLPAHQPPVLPPPHLAMEVPDIDHRRNVPPPMFPRMGPPHTAPYRPPAQPPPPGTEVVGEEDVDMRQPPKRGGPPPHLGGEPPFEKRARPDPPGSSRLVPPLPPLPPQPPPPLPPLPSSGAVDGGGPAGMEPRDRGDHTHRPPPPHDHWPPPRGHEEDFDHRRHNHHHAFSHRGPPHHGHHHAHSPSPPTRYRGERHDRDERHRRDRHYHRDRR